MIENIAVAVTLSAMVLLPLAEILLRRTLHTGVEGASLIVQHLALIVGMLGGAIAAREGRMLALSTLGDSFLRGTGQRIARATAGAVGGTVAAFLSVASLQFVQSERPFSKVLVYSVPVWIVELALPIGFALIAVRLLYRSSTRWPGRLAAFVAAAAMGLLLTQVPHASAFFLVPALLVLAGATVLGTPAFVTLGG